MYTCKHILFILKYRTTPIIVVRTIKLTKIKKEYALIVPESIAKLYNFEVGQIFNLEIKETNNMLKLVILTYATTMEK